MATTHLLQGHRPKRIVWRQWWQLEAIAAIAGQVRMAEPRQRTSRGWADVILALAMVLARRWHCHECHTAGQAKESYKCLGATSCSTATTSSSSQSVPFLDTSRRRIPTSTTSTAIIHHHRARATRQHQPTTLRPIPYLVPNPPPTVGRFAMPFFYSKGFGNRHFGTSLHADRNGVHRGPWRFSLGKFNCFKAH